MFKNDVRLEPILLKMVKNNERPYYIRAEALVKKTLNQAQVRVTLKFY